MTDDGSADTAYLIANNSFQDAVESAVEVDLLSASTSSASLVGTISGNIIGSAGVPLSGSHQGSGIAVSTEGQGLATTLVTSNQVRQYADVGIDVLTGSGSPTMNATVTSNTVGYPGSLAALQGLFVEAGSTAGDGGVVCLESSNNVLQGSGGPATTDFRYRQLFTTTIRLPGYAGAAGDTAAVVTFSQGKNPGSETGSATAAFPTSGGGFTGGAACPTA